MTQRSQAVVIVVVGAIVAHAVLFAQSAADRRLARPPAAAQERRLALVVGNDTYAGAALTNARNDARAVAAALRGLDFSVTLLEDATQAAMGQAIASLGERVTADDVVLFYFAGHGVEVEGRNYLIPIDYRGTSATGVRFGAWAASDIQETLAKARVSMLVLDACRNNPYKGTRDTGGGLARMDASGSLVAFATAAGQTASDNAGAANGLFTQELLRALREPDLNARDVFYRVRDRVYEASNRRQRPAVYDDLLGEFVFRAAAGGSSTAAPVPGATADDLARREEFALWDAINDSRSVAAFEDYLRQYPSGRFRVIAEEKLRELRAARAPAPAPSVPPRPATSAPAVSGDSGELNWIAIPGNVGTSPWRAAFDMGCVPNDAECEDDEKPARRVTLTRPFALGATEVTVRQFRSFISATGHRTTAEQEGSSFAFDGSRWVQSTGVSWRSPGMPQDDRHPVVHVSWQDATAFCGWAGGRLPTDAEWEYAARGGAAGMKYVWGARSPGVGASKAANVADESARRQYSGWPISTGYDDGYVFTAPAGTFAPNAYGLYDMAGNVWEWVSDWYPDNLRNAATQDPAGATSGTWRKLRGGSWANLPRSARLSGRGGTAASDRNDYVGFRCARDFH